MFLIHSVDDGRVPPLEYLAASAITPKIGLGLMYSGGLLTVAYGANKPVYICMTERDAAVSSGTKLPVIRVAPDLIFETVWANTATDRKPGDKVTIAADGLRVTSTTTNGIAEVVSLDSIAAGAKVRVRFN